MNMMLSLPGHEKHLTTLRLVCTLARLDFHPRAFAILFSVTLNPYKKMSRQQLAFEMGIKHSSYLSRSLISLRKKGLVSLEINVEDLRRTFVTPTDKGKTLVKDILKCT